MIRLNSPTLPLLILALIALGGCSSSPSQNSTQTESESQTSASASTSSTDAASGGASTANAPGSSADSAATSGARTVEEIIDDLDGELEASVAVFDGMILDERSKAEAAAASAGGGLDASGIEDENQDEVLFEEGDLEQGLPGYGEFPETVAEAAESEEAAEASAESSANEERSDQNGASAPSTTITGGIPEDVGEGRDDDIVARQIREAALKEKDPALREKLWDEYRKYKNQQAGGRQVP